MVGLLGRSLGWASTVKKLAIDRVSGNSGRNSDRRKKKLTVDGQGLSSAAGFRKFRLFSDSPSLKTYLNGWPNGPFRPT